MSHTFDIQHFVFGTKHRQPTINYLNREALYRFIWAALTKRGCRLYRVNGIEDHIHLVVDVNASYSKSRLMQDIKSTSSFWMKRCGLFNGFRGWCDGFFSESKDRNSLDTIINYVKNQELHHKGETFVAELKRFYRSHGLEWNDAELF